MVGRRRGKRNGDNSVETPKRDGPGGTVLPVTPEDKIRSVNSLWSCKHFACISLRSNHFFVNRSSEANIPLYYLPCNPS
jgi:hypothetical protein